MTPYPGKEPSLAEIYMVLNLDLPVKYNPNMMHVDLAKAFASKVKPSAIWVYDNGVLLNESPFFFLCLCYGSYWLFQN